VAVEVVKMLLDHESIDINVQDIENSTPLHYAAKTGNLDIVKMLLAQDRHYKVDANMEDKDGKKPVYYTIPNGNLEICSLIAELM
jgi:ankyrin repeat protein